MHTVKCGRCGGSGRYTDKNPTNGAGNWCEGCHGDGRVQVPDPTAKCGRCGGSGRYTDRNPTNGAGNWCAGCNGSGYSS